MSAKPAVIHTMGCKMNQIRRQGRKCDCGADAKTYASLKLWRDLVDNALEYSSFDYESPIRAAYFYLIHNLSPDDFASDAELHKAAETINALRLSENEAVAICQAFGADI